MAERFSKLGQGNDYVVEYVQKFMAFSKFAPELVPNEDKKINKFIMGLRHAIHRVISVGGNSTLGEIMEAAKHTEYLDEDEAIKIKTFTYDGGGQLHGLPPRDFGHGHQRGRNFGLYYGGRGRGQGGSRWTYGSDNFVGKERDHETISQDSVAQPQRGSASTSGGAGAQSGGRGCWKCRQMSHHWHVYKTP